MLSYSAKHQAEHNITLFMLDSLSLLPLRIHIFKLILFP